MLTSEGVDDLVNEMLPAFIDEANSQSTALEQLLLQLEEAPKDRELLDALFRCAHTIKGSAGVFGLDRVVEFTHHVETLLDQLREGHIDLTPSLSTLLLQCNDEIRLLVLGARDREPESSVALDLRSRLVERLREATKLESPHGAAQPGTVMSADAPAAALADSVTPCWNIEVCFTADTFRNGIDPLTMLNYVRGLGTMSNLRCQVSEVPTLDQLNPESCHLSFAFELATASNRSDIEQAFKFAREDSVLTLTPILASAPAQTAEPAQEQVAAAPAPAKEQRPRAAAAGTGGEPDNGFIRVHADRLDEVINLLGELVIAGAGASMLARNTRQRALIEANQQITRLIEGIRNSTLKLRMVPIGETFSRFRRVVRDVAADLGKDVALEIVGGETELDKAMVERIADPLMHLVRNALDHGLETPEQRLASNKPSQARLTLSACHESGSILIRIIDDGRGVQRDKVLQRARERGLVEPDAELSDAEILNLLFAPGFSTAEKVTNLSGRGVGMDVVRSNVEAMRGSVTLTSQPGQGSCIEIRLPLTLAIIDGFLVGVGPSKFILPLDAVVEVIAERRTAAVVDPSGRSCVELRGAVLPVVNLRALYALDSPQPERSSVVVVRAGQRRYGVQVDTLLGQHQTVIKPLGLMLRSLRGVSGSSILGTGEVALIFDAHALGQLAAQPRRVARKSIPTPTPTPLNPTSAEQPHS